MTYMAASSVQAAIKYALDFGIADFAIIRSEADVRSISIDDDILYVNDDQAQHDPRIVDAVGVAAMRGVPIEWFGGTPNE